MVMPAAAMSCPGIGAVKGIYELHLLCGRNALYMSPKVKPQSKQAGQGLEDMTGALFHGQAIITYNIWQDLQVGLIFSHRDPTNSKTVRVMHHSDLYVTVVPQLAVNLL